MKDYKVLVLNTDYQPLNQVPLSTTSWQEAFRLIYQGKAYPIKFYDDVVHTVNKAYPIPSVIVLDEYKNIKHMARLSKFNIKLRDNFRCGYCGVVHSPRSCTVDHVKPRKEGGKSTWENLVTACKPCNNKKGHSIIKPKIKPYKPSYYELAQKMKSYRGIYETAWADYVA